MQRAINFFTPMSTFTSAPEKTDRPVDPAVLFSGICLAALLVAILTGVQGFKHLRQNLKCLSWPDVVPAIHVFLNSAPRRGRPAPGYAKASPGFRC
jgi:hypothetical protein